MKNDDVLDFITKLDATIIENLDSLWWLISDFKATRWKICFDTTETFETDWNVELHNGTLLTDAANAELLTSLKYFIIFGVEGDVIESQMSVTTLRRNYGHSTAIIDYLLINAKSLELIEAGLAGITENDLKTLLNTFGSHNLVAESIYQYKARATAFVKNLLDNTSDAIIQNFLKNEPGLADVSTEQAENNDLDIPLESIPSVRAALLNHGFYEGFYHSRLAYGCHANGLTLSKAIYPNTIAGNRPKPRLKILSFYPDDKAYLREYLSVPVRTERDLNISTPKYTSFRKVLCRMKLLHTIGISAPSLSELRNISRYHIALAEEKRFKPVPSDVIFSVFKDATEFHYEHGRQIVDAFCNVVAYSKRNKIPLTRIPDSTVVNLIGPELCKFGVTTLGLSCHRPNLTSKNNLQRKKTKASFYERLRKNNGLIELLQIYIGCVSFVTGALMARRVQELIKLPAKNCMDKSNEWLIFNVEKTSKGLFGIQDTQARPIDSLAATMIQELQRMQTQLIESHFIDDYMLLFSSPSSIAAPGLVAAATPNWNRNIDIMADYFQVRLDSKGRRYYTRQHQLRRFYALLFFHTFNNGGVNGIRWMLGHADVESIWKYINDTIDGASLRGAQSQFVLEELYKGKIENYECLIDLLSEAYGTSDITLIDEDEADLYIQNMMLKGKVKIEPIFYDDGLGKKMRVLAKVTSL
jgi:hypothetical protein